MSRDLTFCVLRHEGYVGLTAQDSKNVAVPEKPAGREFPQRGEVVYFSGHVWLSHQEKPDRWEEAYGKRIGIGYVRPDGDEVDRTSFHINFARDESHLFIETMEFLHRYWERPILFSGANLKLAAENENQEVVLSGVDQEGRTIECRRGVLTFK